MGARVRINTGPNAGKEVDVVGRIKGDNITVQVDGKLVEYAAYEVIVIEPSNGPVWPEGPGYTL